jgi:23S rRNA (cytosine1962-C5)-methyltransferase
MLLETPKNFPDFELLDTGHGYRLERWNDVILQRPDPQIIWPKSLSDAEWSKAWAIFRSPSGGEKGRWDIGRKLPEPWVAKYQNIKFLLRLSPFKHTGLFAEQAANWEWMMEKISNDKLQIPNPSRLGEPRSDKSQNPNFKILNLFAYTGGATMVLAKAGCFVTHVDASKPAISWAKENHLLNNLPTDSVRWILDDAVKFVKRELKRGVKYDGIIMDPPAFGHSPTGKTWKFNDDLPGLLTDCVGLLSDNAIFLIINGYATNSSALSLNNLLEDSIRGRPGRIEFGELCLKQKKTRMISTGIFARWAS